MEPLGKNSFHPVPEMKPPSGTGKKKTTKRKGSRKKSKFLAFSLNIKRIAAGIIILMILILTAFLSADRYLSRKEKPVPPPRPTPRIEKPLRPVEPVPEKPPVFEVYTIPETLEPVAPEPTLLPKPPPSLPEVRPRAAVIIDDMGYDIRIARRLLQIEPAITWSILPGSPSGKKIAELARQSRVEVMLHLPMEPKEYPHVDPGPGALLSSMDPDKLIAQLHSDLDSIDHIRGVNNHMGSHLTTLSPQMDQVLSTIKLRNLFFIDSRTSPASMAGSSAKLFRVPFAQRDVFLDHNPHPEAIRKQIRLLVLIAKHNGHAVAIGHPHETTLTVLSEEIDSIRKEIQIVPASEVVRVPE